MTVTYHRETHHSKCSKCLPLALRHAIKQSLIYRLINEDMLVARHISCLQMKWNGIFQPDTISTHKHTSLVSDNMFLRFGFSRYLQVLVHWCGFHEARGESEWCIGLLLWCLANQTVAAIHLSSWWLSLFSAPRVYKSTELLWHKTPDFTPDMRPPNRPYLNPVV